MTEAGSNNYEIIPKDFYGNKIEFIDIDNEIWITARALGTGLEYVNPRRSIMKLFYRYQDELGEFSRVVNLGTPSGMQETTVFSESGAYMIMMFSKQSRAKEFRKWVVKVVKDIRKTGSYIEKVDNPYDLFIKQAEAVKQIWIELKEQNNELLILKGQVNSVDSELKTFEQKYDDEKIITPQTRRCIKDLIHESVKNSGMHWNNFWPKIWKAFGITTTTDISEKLGQKIIKWIKINPYFKQFLNENKEV